MSVGDQRTQWETYSFEYAVISIKFLNQVFLAVLVHLWALKISALMLAKRLHRFSKK